MTVWEKGNIKYLLELIDKIEFKNGVDIRNKIFVINYYGLLYFKRSFFDYEFIKGEITINSREITSNIVELIRQGLVKYENYNNNLVYRLTDLGKKIKDDFNTDYKVFNELLLKIKEEKTIQNPVDFVFVKRKEEGEIIKI